MTEEELRQLTTLPESTLHEYKQQWYNLDNGQGKGDFVKDVLALANSAQPAKPARIVFGVRDQKHGGGVIGLEQPQHPERTASILASHTLPVVGAQLFNGKVDGKNVDVLTVNWSKYGPHHSIRDMDKLLRSDVLYTRRECSIGVMTMDEMETAFRDKDFRLGRRVATEPLQIGFVEITDWSYGKVVARITNVIEQEVSGIHSMFEITLRPQPSVLVRQKAFHDLQLAPQEQRESEIFLPDIYVPSFQKTFRDISDINLRHIDLTFRVRYRALSGLIEERETMIKLNG